MSKAEERSKKLIIPKQVDDIEELCRFYYIKGYHQAEKDLELTWEDIKLIWNITDKMVNMPEEEFYKEVLRRFKEMKKKINLTI